MVPVIGRSLICVGVPHRLPRSRRISEALMIAHSKERCVPHPTRNDLARHELIVCTAHRRLEAFPHMRDQCDRSGPPRSFICVIDSIGAGRPVPPYAWLVHSGCSRPHGSIQHGFGHHFLDQVIDGASRKDLGRQCAW